MMVNNLATIIKLFTHHYFFFCGGFCLYWYLYLVSACNNLEIFALFSICNIESCIASAANQKLKYMLPTLASFEGILFRLRKTPILCLQAFIFILAEIDVPPFEEMEW